MPKITKKAKNSKYVNTASEYIGTKASERRRIKAPGQVGDGTSWKKWWLANEEDIGNATETIILKIEMEQQLRFTSFVNWARIYGNWEAKNWWASNLNSFVNDSNDGMMLRLNLIQSVIDAAAAKIAKEFPQPYFTTSDGDYFDKLKAEDLNKYVKGAMQKAKVYEKTISQFRDSEVYGTGALYFYMKDECIHCDWVPTFELRVADYDGISKEPRSMHRVRMVNKEVLIEMYPKHEQLIEEISTNPAIRMRDYNNIVDMVRVKESWHLPSGKKASDGVHTVTINDKCLLKEEYTLPMFPIIIFRWMDASLGFYGRSVTEEVYAVQMSLDELLLDASQSYSMVGSPLVFVPDGAQVPEDVILSNFIARLVPYRGNTPPTFVTPEPLPQSFFQWVGQHIQWVFQIVGLSQTSATGQNQLGPNASGAAIRELVDIETSRFAQVSKRWEDNTVNIAKLIVALSKEAAKKGINLEVEYQDERKRIEKIDFKAVELSNFQCQAVSQSPDSIAGRVQTVEDWFNRNLISKERYMELVNEDPDLQKEIDIQMSSMRVCEMRIADMVRHGIAYQPESYMINLPQIQQLSQGIYNMLITEECPEDRLQLVRNWIDAVVALQTQSSPTNITPPQAPLGPQTPPAGSPQPQIGSPAPPSTPQPLQ